VEALTMGTSFRAGLALLVGIALLAVSLALKSLLLEGGVWIALTALLGAALTAVGAYALRVELAGMLRQRRGEIALYSLGVVLALSAVAWLSLLFPHRIDMSEGGQFSLSPQTVSMLEKIDKPVHITFFHDPMMRETVELYQQAAALNKLITVEFFDPMLNPAQARMMGVQFAGTALMRSETRKLQVNGGSETDIANGILRVSRGSTQRLCFLEGHGEPDPFSLESHDHMEGDAGHSHGLGSQFIIHEQHGMAKARTALEAMNYTVGKVSLMRADASLDGCALLLVVGAKSPLMANEVKAVRDYLDKGGNAFFLFDPFVRTGLEPVIESLGVNLDNDLVIDDASHFWADPSAPAVSDYNRHQITQGLPMSFFPGARSLSPTEKRVPGSAVIPLVNSSKKSFGEFTPDRVEYDEGKDQSGPNTIMVLLTRKPVSAVTSAMMQHGADKAGAVGATAEDVGGKPGTAVRKSRIAIAGDSDFATNSFFNIMGNGALFLNTVNYLAAQENLIGVEPRNHDIPRVNMTNRQMKATLFLCVILIPALLAVVGIAVWWKQR
jgi:ABC-type uncharacterized transport system involved in gliding motility auxiliary subunit